MTVVGFAPTPLRTGAGSQRLRPLGQTVLLCTSFPTDFVPSSLQLMQNTDSRRPSAGLLATLGSLAAFPKGLIAQLVKAHG